LDTTTLGFGKHIVSIGEVGENRNVSATKAARADSNETFLIFKKATVKTSLVMKTSNPPSQRRKSSKPATIN
jgi:hypothetical protein